MKVFKTSVMWLCAAALSLLLATAVAAEDPIRPDRFHLTVNGDRADLGENVPVIVESRALLPLTFVCEQLGGDDYDWNEADKAVMLARGETVIKLVIDSDKAFVNDEETNLNVAPILYNDSPYVPLAFVATAFDMSVFWEETSSTAFIADNARIDRIIKLMNSGITEPDEVPTKSASLTMDMEMDFFGESVEVHMEGIIQQDPANTFQRIALTTTVPGEDDILVEIFDDGNAMYTVANGEVIKMASAFALSDDMMSQYIPVLGADIDRRFYAGLNLLEDETSFTIYGTMFAPDEFFQEIISGIDGIGELAQLMAGLEMSITEPFSIVLVYDSETGFPLSMQMRYAIEMSMTIEGEELLMNIKYNVDMPKFEYGVVFDTIIPAEIMEAAIDMAEVLE